MVQKYNVIICTHKLLRFCIELEVIMLNEINQAEKEKYGRISLRWHLRS